ncbi:hypothetical protein PISMIDRAFT_669809 [Pisolithus microcarpus 441]|uniref:Uncharacterized protein n=1 Tax=Pisolithus microcarpus 441 TaxID=765257 RepID=A0A0C9Y3L3_9AGAM|nr:hypothetical protein PISMIDRAFT_683247 [Pisolithus microcarpus 441]KIK30881.1 hypothetical protein PISMIDRAFT_669809 [Pisolithus microcarpus 441]
MVMTPWAGEYHCIRGSYTSVCSAYDLVSIQSSQTVNQHCRVDQYAHDETTEMTV